MMNPLFGALQRNSGPGDAEMAGFMAVFLGICCVAMLIGIAIQYFFCKNLSDLLKLIAPRNREVEPGQAYMLFIPFYNLYWIFALTAKIADSLDHEFYERRWRPDGDFGRQMGMWYGICTVGSIVPYIGIFPGIGSFVLWILYWVKTSGYRLQLTRDYGSHEDEEVDDRPRRKRREQDNDDYR